MAGKLSPNAQRRLNEIDDLLHKLQRVHGMVEAYAAAKTNVDSLGAPLKRAFGNLRMNFMGAGLDPLAQMAGSMEIAAGRGQSQHAKARILREGVGSMRFQLELEQRSIMSEEAKKAHEDAE